MPNYRYNMPEYERRNNYRMRNSCEVPRRSRYNAEEMSCAVNDSHDTLAGMPAAMAYVPWTMWRDIYDDRKALCQGTIFKELDKPFRWIGGAC